MLPTSDPSIRKAKKKINTWFLDNQWCIKSGKISICLNLVLIIVVLVMYSAKHGMISLYEKDIAVVNNQIAEFNELLEKEQIEKQLLREQLEQTKGLVEYKEKLIEQKEELLAMKVQTIEDLKVGLGAMELKVKTDITTAPSLNFGKKDITINIGEDSEKKQAVKEAFLHAWNSYKQYSWGMDELKPVSGSSYNWLGLGVTIVDALDTLWIMDLKDEFKLARDWVATSLSFDKNKDVSVFETTIRELGGLLGAYEFSRDKIFLDKAEDLADRLLGAFDSPTKLPVTTVNLASKQGKGVSWTGGASILSEMGTLQLEFLYLAYHTKNPRYAILPMRVFKHLDGLQKNKGLYNLYVNVNSGRFQGSEVSLGALGDSFYEYMLKLWLFTNKQFNGYSRMYKESSVGIKDVLVQTTPSGFKYVGQIGRAGILEEKMEHLTCFSGGMFALGAHHKIDPNHIADDLILGGEITRSCHESYTRTQTKIGPEYFEFRNGREFAVPYNGRHYLLRPETVESYFVLWRTTHDQKYRDWAWEAFQAIEKHCRLAKGYSGLSDVDNVNTGHDDLQQSFFLAETLKYLYLIFTDDSVVPLDKYVFNTEAHPFGIITEDPSKWPREIVDELIAA